MRAWIAVVTAAALGAGCGSGTAGSAGGTGATAVLGFKSVNFTFMNFGTVATTPSITVTAPEAGTFDLRAVGYCNMAASTSALALGLSTSSGPLTTSPGSWFVWSGPAGQVSYYLNTQVPAAAGQNTYYLTPAAKLPDGVTATNATDCGGNITAFFVAGQLP